MAPATSSLPVPVSPVMRTVESLGATLEMRDSTAFKAGEVPTISSNIEALSISSRRATFSCCSFSSDRMRAEEKLQQENVALREEIDKASMFEEIVGTSPALKAVLSRISKVAPSDSTVLITGETGTGKELVAGAIHRRSNRGSRTFVSVNCAAIPRELIASELFGHEKGAFTGATQQRSGRFELANGGTLFLDEVGDLPAETQIALLRVLQEHEFERVGGAPPIPAYLPLNA